MPRVPSNGLVYPREPVVPGPKMPALAIQTPLAPHLNVPGRPQQEPLLPLDPGRIKAAGATGAAIEAAGAALDRYADRAERARQREEELWVRRSRAEDGETWDRHLFEQQQSAPEGAPNFTGQTLAQFDDYMKGRLEAAPSDGAREIYHISLAETRHRIGQKAMEFEAGSRIAKARSDVDAITRMNVNQVLTDPRRFDSLLFDTEDAIKALNLPAAIEAKDLALTRTSFAEALVQGTLDKSPASAIQLLNGGALDPFLDPKRKASLLDHADAKGRHLAAEARQRQAERRGEMRAQIEPAFRDAMAAYTDGKDFPLPFTEAQLRTAFPDTWAAKWSELQGTRRLGVDVATLSLMPPAEQDALVRSYQPAVGSGYAAQADRQHGLLRARDLDRRAREDDPAGYVLARSEAVRTAFAAAKDNPAALGTAVRLSLAVQAESGIPEHARRALPKAEAVERVAVLMAVPGEDRADAIQGTANAFGEHWPMVYRDLVRDGKLPAEFRVLATVNDPVTRKRLGDLANIKTEDLRLGAGKHARSIDDAVAAAIEPLRRSFALATDGSSQAAQFEHAAQRLAYHNIVLGLPPEDAANQAVTALVVDRYDFVEQARSGLVARAPKNQGPRVRAYADRVLNSLGAGDLKDSGNHPELLPIDRQARMRSGAGRGGWITNKDDNGWVLVNAIREPVFRADGRHVEFLFKDVTDAPKSTYDFGNEVTFGGGEEP